MGVSVARSETFYREWLMGRGKWNPEDFGIADLTREQAIDAICNQFADTFHGTWTVDELVLHPVDAIRFCQDVRYRQRWYDCPDDIILRSLMSRRKNP
ncbi:hypothetical protein [Planctomyces sp. SH-PL14]|uniref:hypothetical protein n=1 Tax=Planctomyces sp. SH-PL14 TaxID=1632864 RepID=UPI00078E2C63|nr:hypothetical protein [Planctomyces sp. SH-PL14]AMV20396.1 hypothetical protein VT03_21035 [Planctomyces sp. SH-PL14]